MPVYQNQNEETSEEKKCKVCNENTTNQPTDEAVECDVCLQWICFTCSGVLREVYNLANEKETTVDYICKPCKEELPQIREIVAMKKRQNQLIEQVNQEAETNKLFRTQQIETNNQYNVRINALEQLVQDKSLKDYPPLTTFANVSAQANTLKKVLTDQAALDRKVKAQEHTLKEDKRKESKENNLVVYGIPENTDDDAQQMIEDFKIIKQLYETKATLHSRDLTQITRLGTKDEKIRPIRLTFANPEKRKEILRNNKNLVLEDAAFETCTASFCNDHSKHKHIYVSPDKTWQQREDEKKLRAELKIRKSTEEDLIIRNGKIVKKTTRARWVDVSEDDY
mgnify:CR=1 FL=1